MQDSRLTSPLFHAKLVPCWFQAYPAIQEWMEKSGPTAFLCKKASMPPNLLEYGLSYPD